MPHRASFEQKSCSELSNHEGLTDIFIWLALIRCRYQNASGEGG